MSRLAALTVASLPAILLATGCTDTTSIRPSCAPGACSELTLAGLDFVSAAPSPLAAGAARLHPTAVGGTQTVQLIDSSDGQPLALDYSAVLQGPSLTLTSTSGALLRVDASAAGASILRIHDPETLELYDETTLTAAAVSRVSLLPLAGEPGVFELRLHDASGNLLVDDSASVAAGRGLAAFARGTAWDRVLIPATAPETVVVEAGGQLHQVTL